MACELCGSPTWVDDDLHWTWCKNGRCSESYSDNEKVQEYLIDLLQKFFVVG
ncbi:MAG: hypothetical protein WA959_23345 [Rivularia sp. (in: cyanobacteria)]